MSFTYKNPDFPIGSLLLIIFSFLLGFLDMSFLSQSFVSFGMDSFLARLASLLLATMANFMAFTWGKGNGERMEKKTLNKRSLLECFLWIVIGIVYIVMRILEMVKLDRGSGSFLDIYGDKIVMTAVLAVSYISTGILIQQSARKICWADAVAVRKAKKKFEDSREDLAEDSSELSESIGILSRFDMHFKSLEIQRKKIENGIYKAEKATMSDIVSKMLTRNTEISPSAAREVMDDVFATHKKAED